MTDQATPPNPGAVDAAPTPTGDGGLDARIAAVNAMLDDGSSATAGEPTASDGAPLLPASTPRDGSPAASDDPAKRAEERRARLEEAKAKMRMRVDDKARQTAQERLAADLAAAQKRADEAEAKAKAALDRAMLKDPIALLRAMEDEGVAAEDVAAAIRERLQNPEAVAQRVARQAMTPEVAALKKQLDEQNELIAQLRQERESERMTAEEQRHAQQFVAFVQSNASHAPMAARLLAKNPDEFLQIASLAAERVPGGGAQALLDQVEDILDREVRPLAQSYAGVFEPAPSQQTAPPLPPRAAAQATTVSNSLAQGRTAIVDEEKDWAALPLEERAARLIRSA